MSPRRNGLCLSIKILLLLTIALSPGVTFAQDHQIVPEFYRKFFVHYVDERSFPERILDSIGLKTQDIGRSFALIAGISSYPNLSLDNPFIEDPTKLEPAAEDIRKMTDYLKHYEYFDEIVVLQDQDMVYKNLEYFLQAYFPQRLREFPHSRFLFAYSGHGKDGHLVLSEAKSLDDEAHIMKLPIVRELFNEVLEPGFHVVALINACQSGAFIVKPQIPFGIVTRMHISKGAHAITAGGTNQIAWHNPDIGSGSVFFEKFFEGLGGRADTYPSNADGTFGDGIIMIDELGPYLRQEVQFSTNQEQTPYFSNWSWAKSVDQAACA